MSYDLHGSPKVAHPQIRNDTGAEELTEIAKRIGHGARQYYVPQPLLGSLAPLALRGEGRDLAADMIEQQAAEIATGKPSRVAYDFPFAPDSTRIFTAASRPRAVSRPST